MEFEAFEKIPRLRRPFVITEKLDGTNASILIDDDLTVQAASRKRVITPGKSTDNYGFAAWVEERSEKLADTLGPGRHFGEWWGHGIQRGYGLDEKRFSLFNTFRWDEYRTQLLGIGLHVVPVLYEGVSFNTLAVQAVCDLLGTEGSEASPGFDDPEGIVIFHPAAKQYFKVTLKNDEAPKGQVAAA